MLRGSLSLLAPGAFAAALPAVQGVLRSLGVSAAAQCREYAKKVVPDEQDAQKKAPKAPKDKQPKKDKAAGASKRPLSAYTLFVKDRAAGHNMSGPEMMKKLGAEWRSMSDADKAPYMSESAALRSKTMQARQEAKKPPSAYNLFFKEQYAKLGSSMKVTEAAKEIGARWKGLPDHDKQRYKDRAEPALAAWKAAQPPKV